MVRRYSVTLYAHANIGIQTLSRNAQSIELYQRTTGFSAASAIPGIWLREENATGEMRFALPRGSFDLRESLELVEGEQRYLLVPAELEETGSDFEIGRYREQTLA